MWIVNRLMNNLMKITMWFKSYKHFHELQRYARKDSHRDNSAHLQVMEFFFHCEAHQDAFNTYYVLLLKHKK